MVQSCVDHGTVTPSTLLYMHMYISSAVFVCLCSYVYIEKWYVWFIFLSPLCTTHRLGVFGSTQLYMSLFSLHIYVLTKHTTHFEFIPYQTCQFVVSAIGGVDKQFGMTFVHSSTRQLM